MTRIEPASPFTLPSDFPSAALSKVALATSVIDVRPHALGMVD
jgi:hypothetical protein